MPIRNGSPAVERGMRIPRIVPLAAVSLLAVAIASTAVQAHDFWLQPSSFQPPVGAAIRIRLMVGDRFAGEPLPRDEAKIERFFAVTPGGERRHIAGRDGVEPAGVIRFDTPGLYILGYEGRPSSVRLSPEAFEAYLKEEGLERIGEERSRRGENRQPAREQFSRSVKALVRAGSTAGTTGFDRAIGLPLEIVPERDPFTPGLTELPVRLLEEGQPLEGGLLVVLRKAAAGARSVDVLFTGRSGPDGRAVLTIAPGVLLVKAVHMVRAQPGTEAEWRSTWTSLTFENGAANPSSAPVRRPE